MTTKKLDSQLLIFLILPLSFFMVKGIRYAFIGSFIPIIFIALVISILLLTYRLNAKSFIIALKSWSIFLVFWSLTRIVIPFLFAITPGLTETHIREQFTIVEFIITIAIFILGIFIWRKRSNAKHLPHPPDSIPGY